MSKTTNVFLGLILAVTVLVAAQTKADVISWEWNPAKSDGLNESVANMSKGFTLTAEDIGSGVKFTFTNSNYNEGSDGKGNNFGYSKFNSDLYFYNVSDAEAIFEDSQMKPGGNLGQLGGYEPGYPLYNKGKDSAFNIGTKEYSATQGAEYGSLEFILKYVDPEMGWSLFLEDVENWIIAMDFKGMDSEPSSFPFHAVVVRASESSGTPTPEPATLAVLGIGLTGLGWASRRRK